MYYRVLGSVITCRTATPYLNTDYSRTYIVVYGIPVKKVCWNSLENEEEAVACVHSTSYLVYLQKYYRKKLIEKWKWLLVFPTQSSFMKQNVVQHALYLICHI